MLQMSTEEEDWVPPTPLIEYEVGDKVKVINGPFSGFPGEIEEVEHGPSPFASEYFAFLDAQHLLIWEYLKLSN